MSSPRAHNPARVAAVFALALLLAMMVPFTAGAAESGGAEPKVRTDPGDLPGYTIEGEGAPLSMLLYEPVIPVPVDPGEPHGEGSISFTSTTLETGPQARALASSIWPGPAVGDGFSTICECDENWRVKSESNFPSKNPTAAQEAGPTGAGMVTSALGLDVFSRATSSVSPNEEALAFGNVHSRTDATVLRNTAISKTVASAKDISIGGGVIQIKSVRTFLQATSNAKKGLTEGVTEVNGLVIGGQGYTIDQEGLQPVEGEKSSDPVVELPAMPGAAEMRKQLGIEIELAKHSEEVIAADATRSAGGLRISINTLVLKNAVTENLPVDDVFGQLPDELKANLAALRALAPQVDFVFGRGEVHAAGVEALKLPPLDFGGPLLPPAAPPAGTTTAPPPAIDTGTTAPIGGGTAAPPSVAPLGGAPGGAPVVPSAQPIAAPAVAGTQVAAELPDFFGGLPPGMVIGGLALAALGGRALAGFTGVAMSGVGGALCDRGARRAIPNLRAQG